MSDNNCYVLPLAPQDLVAIYKVKEDAEEFVLWVNYERSREKLSAQHIIIYLANTNFKATFSAVDSDLLVQYIKSDFMVDSPLLSRLLVNIIKYKMGHDINDQEQQLFALFGEQDMIKFIAENESLVDELIDTLGQIVPYVLHKIQESLTPEQLELELNLKGVLDGIEILDKPSNCGPNIARLITTGFDAFLLVLSKNGLGNHFNKQVFNDTPKYFGKDLYFTLCNTNVTDQILEFFPPNFILANASTSE